MFANDKTTNKFCQSFSYNRNMGRKKKKPADKRTEYIRVMLTAAEKAEIEKFAIAAGMDVGTWVRVKSLELIRTSNAS
jgi:hypothetical protein